MSQATYYNVIVASAFALSLACSASAPPNLKSALKIVNSTNIRELKHNYHVAEDKSGAVTYVYPAGTQVNVQNSQTAAEPHQKPEDEPMAVPKGLFGQQTNLKTASAPAAKVGKIGVAPTAVKEKAEVSSTTGEVVTTKPGNTTKGAESPKPTTSATSVLHEQGNQTAASDNGKPDCITRVESVDDENNPYLAVYNATTKEVEAMGYEVFDTLCKGEDEWDKVISAGALASLCCGSG